MGDPQNTGQDTQVFGVPPQLALHSKCAGSPEDCPVLPKGCPLYWALEGLESVAEEVSTLSLNLGHNTERSRKLVEGEERRLSMPAQPNHEEPSKEMRFPFQWGPEKQRTSHCHPHEGGKI